MLNFLPQIGHINVMLIKRNVVYYIWTFSA